LLSPTISQPLSQLITNELLLPT